MTPTMTAPGRGVRTAAGRVRRGGASGAGRTCSRGARARRGGAAGSEDLGAAAGGCGRRDSPLLAAGVQCRWVPEVAAQTNRCCRVPARPEQEGP